MNEPDPQREENPYLASEVTDVATSATDRKKNSTVATVFAVIAGLVVAVLVFAITFFLTCLGTMSIHGMDNQFGMVATFLAAALTAAAAFVLTILGFLKVVRALKN